MAHPYALSGFQQGGIGDTSGDWNCPSCGDRNFATRVECRKCGTPNPEAKMPDVNEVGFKTAMCSFFLANRCNKGAYCTFAHGEEELALGKQMMAAKVEAMPAPALYEAPAHIQQFLAGFTIKPIPLKQFLTMEPPQQELVIGQGPLFDARDPTAMLISRMVKVRKMQNLQKKAAGQNHMALLAQANVTPPAGAEFQVMLNGGPLGIGANWLTGLVDRVVDGGQGSAAGVCVGDWFIKVNDAAYSEKLLDATRAIGQPFMVTLLRPHETVAPAPQGLGQFAANLGVDWALGGGGAH
eukprot:TRINITY_DN49317_c0_g1_i1.p1 TRINITY_DN49317_c0_g1~~TRINITY_DN49317_c0_g1_i1.p1  ORF type:complete len:296 (+),score=58.46 TRINITY_DN49317_c0_g1_i1:19-906(+)